jgi:Protein of unknown function (DUF4238)
VIRISITPAGFEAIAPRSRSAASAMKPEAVPAARGGLLKLLDPRSYHQDWTIIRNATAYPFITSDNPVAIHTSPKPLEPMTRYLPITPTLCLSVCYDRKIILAPNDPAMPPKGAVRCATASDRSPKFVNKLVAQCPEDLVFSSAPSPGIQWLVRNCAKFRVHAEFIRVPASEPDAIYQGTIIRVRDMGKLLEAQRPS